jgi:alkylhydroperoxidase family enzyme
LSDWEASALFDTVERLVLEFADAMTITGREVTDELFARVREHFDDDAIVELTEIVAWKTRRRNLIAHCGFRRRNSGTVNASCAFCPPTIR